MPVESSSMATKLGEDELELCLSLGGPFKRTEKPKPIKIHTDGKPNAVRGAEEIGADLDGRTRKKQKRSGEEGECKRTRTECNGNGITNGVDLVLSFGEVGNGYVSGQFKEAVTMESPVSNSSSEISDPCSSAQQGGSCDFGKNTDQIKLVNHPVNKFETGTEEIVQSTDGSSDVMVLESQERCVSVVTKEPRKPPKPRPNGNGNGNGKVVNGRLLPFAQMPCVTSTGDGPEGKTVNGFLYRYSKSEISIICVCHGTSFTPAEFIIHAGGTNVSHPLRHITVVPSTF